MTLVEDLQEQHVRGYYEQMLQYQRINKPASRSGRLRELCNSPSPFDLSLISPSVAQKKLVFKPKRNGSLRC